MMKLLLYKSIRIHLAETPLKTYLWHEEDVGMTRSGFAKLKYTHSELTLKFLVEGVSGS